MIVAPGKIRRLCKQKGISLTCMLKRAGVSRNAYYSLTRKETLLPESLLAVARELGVPPSRLLEQRAARASMEALLSQVDVILRRHPDADRDNIRHTLLILREKPVDRLRRALSRGRPSHFH